MKQKLWSLADNFTIKNDAGEDVATVEGKTWSIGDKLTFFDALGNERAFIQQKLFTWGPTYEIYRDRVEAVVDVGRHVRCRDAR